ncbi:MAG: putative metalloendopeptidase [Ilumatobacteraceae bacterium]|nr:putative metalloendopeptidase [Ilumatobacteraceae bacterium]
MFVIPVATVGASNSGQTSKDVADRIIQLQDKADKTAAALAQAEIEQGDLSGQIAVAQADVAQKSSDFAGLQAQLAQIAVDRYMSGGTDSADIFFGSPIDALQTEALSAAAYDAGAITLDQVETAKADLEAEQAKLEQLLAQNDQLTATMVAKQAEINDQLAQLVALKATLVDAESKKAYADAVAAKKAKEAKAEAEAAAKQAAAQAAAQASSNTSHSSGGATATVIDAGTVTTVAGAPDNAIPAATPTTVSSNDKPPDTPNLPTAPQPATDDSVDNPDGTSGLVDPPKDPVVVIDTSFLCPMAGPTAFGDTWGDARSGGRHHEGVDMMAAFGTPEVAVVSGFATFKTNALGGNVISLVGDDGNRYYYAHLSSWEGQSRQVAQGDVIGYVGHTGDTSANHLHFEIHPGGGAAVNPYPTVRKYC